MADDSHDDFDGTILSPTDGFYASPIHGRIDLDVLEKLAKKATYHAEVAEIARLREALKQPRMAGQELGDAARRKGRAVLDARLAKVKANYGGPLPLPPSPKSWEPARTEAYEAGRLP